MCGQSFLLHSNLRLSHLGLQPSLDHEELGNGRYWTPYRLLISDPLMGLGLHVLERKVLHDRRTRRCDEFFNLHCKHDDVLVVVMDQQSVDILDNTIGWVLYVENADEGWVKRIVNSDGLAAWCLPCSPNG